MSDVRAFFVTGTDTGVGKTLVTAALLRRCRERGLRVAGMKPIASGCDVTPDGLRNEDALAAIRESSVDLPYEVVNPLAYEPAIAPHIAAEEAGRPIDLDLISACFQTIVEKVDLILVEGAGGWRIPLGAGHTLDGLAARLWTPVILVVGLRLGCLNHALLTADSIAARGLRVAGWVGNGIDPDFARRDRNVATLRELLPAPCLGIVPPLPGADVGAAAACLDVEPLLA
jgi:dethiobiotin synthetase